jgi:hypothetical protein
MLCKPWLKRPQARNNFRLYLSVVCPVLRRTGSTNITGERICIPRFIVSRVLNQLSDTGGAAAVTGIYDRNEYFSEKRRTLEAWSTLLVEITGDKKRGPNAVQMAALNDAN